MTAESNVLTFPPLRATASVYAGDEALLGPSPAIARVWSQIHRVAPNFRAAIITGEPGTGAEAAARSLHALSPVNKLPFVVVDANHAELLFTPSASATHTICEGLIFIPDVDHLTPVTQRGLIRKLRMRGRASLRIVAATTTELRASVSAGRFSADLAEILGAIRIALPPLRDRAEDIPLLATHLVQREAARLGLRAPTLTSALHDALIAHLWPGNIIQLGHVIEYMLSNTTNDTFTAEDFTTAAKTIAEPSSLQPLPTRMVRLEEIVQEHIHAVLIACAGNKLRAAEVLGISRSTLYRMLDGAAANPTFSLAG